MGSEDGLQNPTSHSHSVFVSMAGKRAPGLKGINGHVESHQVFEETDYSWQADIESNTLSFEEAIQYCKENNYAGFTYNKSQKRAYYKSEDGLQNPTSHSHSVFVSMAGKRAPGLKGINGHVESHQAFEETDYSWQADIESNTLSFEKAIQYCKENNYAGFTYNKSQKRAYYKSED